MINLCVVINPVIHLGLANGYNVNSPKIVLPVRQNDSIWVSFDSYDQGSHGLCYELVIEGEVKKLWIMRLYHHQVVEVGQPRPSYLPKR